MTPQEYNKLREQEIIGQEMADETVKSIQLRKDIMKLALAESATNCTIMCGTLFAKFDVSISLKGQWHFATRVCLEMSKPPVFGKVFRGYTIRR